MYIPDSQLGVGCFLETILFCTSAVDRVGGGRGWGVAVARLFVLDI